MSPCLPLVPQMEANVKHQSEALVADARRQERERLGVEMTNLAAEAARAVASWKREVSCAPCVVVVVVA